MEIKKLTGVENVKQITENNQQVKENDNSAIDINLAEQTQDVEENPDLDLNFDLKSIDTSISFSQKKDKSPKAFGDEISNIDVYKDTPFTKTKRFEDTSLKANYTINPELNQNKVTFGLNYVNKKDFQASADLQYNKTGNSDSIGIKGTLLKGFELIDGKGEVNATVIGNHTSGDDTTLFNNKVNVIYESEPYNIQNVQYSIGTKLSEETTISNGTVTDARIGAEAGIKLNDPSFFGIFSTGAEVTGGVYADLTPNKPTNLIGKGNFVIFKQFSLDELVYARISAGCSFAGNNEFVNFGQNYRFDVKAPLSFSTERALALGVNYSVDQYFDGEHSTQRDLNVRTAFTTDKGNDIYAEYNYDITNNAHSASIGTKIKL